MYDDEAHKMTNTRKLHFEKEFSFLTQSTSENRNWKTTVHKICQMAQVINFIDCFQKDIIFDY